MPWNYRGLAGLMLEFSDRADRVEPQSTQAPSRGIELMPRRPAPIPEKRSPSRQQTRAGGRAAAGTDPSKESGGWWMSWSSWPRRTAGLLRRLTARFDVAAPPRRVGRRDAPGDHRRDPLRPRAQINHNFAYDHAALQRGEAESEPLDRLGSVAAVDGAGPGADEARELPGRDER